MLEKLKAIFSEDSPTKNSEEEAIRIAAAALLFELSRADNTISAEERSSISTALSSHFSLSDAELKELMVEGEQESADSHAVHPYTKLINDNFSAHAKTRLIETLWVVAYADGNLDKYEEHFIRKIADLIYIPHSSYIKAKLSAQI